MKHCNKKKVARQTIALAHQDSRQAGVPIQVGCAWFGITKQAYYKKQSKSHISLLQQEIVLQRVQQIKQKHPCIGSKKLYHMISGFLADTGIKLGRDAFHKLLSENGLLAKPRRRRVYTTDSKHPLRKYKNLVKFITPSLPGEVIVSDITYWRVKEKVYYISFVTDAYSKKILGYELSQSLGAEGSLKALKMALKDIRQQGLSLSELYHHSDRGVQYCCNKYTRILKKAGTGISMTESGDPRDNAVAERVNGIIKNEYLNKYLLTDSPKDVTAAAGMLDKAVYLYNNERPHMSLSMLTPGEVHSKMIANVSQLWTNYQLEEYRKSTNISTINK